MSGWNAPSGMNSLPQANSPELWRTLWPRLTRDMHKHARGHVCVLGGRDLTGAAVLVARAAMRAGAGLCTLIAPEGAGDLYRQIAPPHVMVAEGRSALADRLADQRPLAVVVGPGGGVGPALRDLVFQVLASGRPAVLDADVFASFAQDPESLFHALRPSVVLTPHMGEYARLFPNETKVVAAAAMAGAVVLRKGADTVIADPSGRVVVNSIDAPWLATAGAGDVLSGVVAALMAQGMPAFSAAAAAAWCHGECALRSGPGLVASDLPEILPEIMAPLYRDRIEIS